MDKAKGFENEIRTKSGLPDDDAKPDLERLMEEKRKVAVSSQAAFERSSYQGTTQWCGRKLRISHEQIDEALASLPSNMSTIALVDDLYKAKHE